jgi:hypothetical protein
MSTNSGNVGSSAEDCRNEYINKFLAVSHQQFTLQHREALLDYIDALADINGPLGCSVIAYNCAGDEHGFVIKMLDNHLNLLRSSDEQIRMPEFASLRICSATEREKENVLKREPTPENSIYAAEQYYKQWVQEDEKLSSLTSFLLYFIDVYSDVYQYRTLMIRLDDVKTENSSFKIKMSNGLQTVELTMSYPVIAREYKALLGKVGL